MTSVSGERWPGQNSLLCGLIAAREVLSPVHSPLGGPLRHVDRAMVEFRFNVWLVGAASLRDTHTGAGRPTTRNAEDR